MDDFDDYSTDAGTQPEPGPARDGFLWVNPNTHVVLAAGDEPKPETANVKLRRYFAVLDAGIDAFAGHEMGSAWKDEVRRVVGEAEILFNESFRECFFLVNDNRQRSNEYLAIVFGQNRGGSVWARKNAIHSTRQVKNSAPLIGKNSHLFEVVMPGFIEKGPKKGSAAETTRLVCPSTRVQLPLNGKCDIAQPGCAICGG